MDYSDAETLILPGGGPGDHDCHDWWHPSVWAMEELIYYSTFMSVQDDHPCQTESTVCQGDCFFLNQSQLLMCFDRGCCKQHVLRGAARG